MSNQLALVLGTIILAGVGADVIFNDGEAILFLGRKLEELIEWVAFWR